MPWLSHSSWSPEAASSTPLAPNTSRKNASCSSSAVARSLCVEGDPSESQIGVREGSRQ